MKLESKVEKFPGHVILPDYLNIFQVRALEDSFGELNKIHKEFTEQADSQIWLSIGDEKRLPVLLACVAEWHIEGIPEHPTLQTFPMSPISVAHDLIEPIYNAIVQMWSGEDVPND